MTTFPEWLERHLGTMAEGVDTELVAGTSRVFVCRYPDQPAEGATTYVTVGLSKTWLHANDRHVRQELMLSRWGDEEYDCARLLPWICRLVLDSGDAILLGEILPPAGPLLPGATAEALVGLHPAYHPEEFGVYRGDAGGDEGHPPVGVTWLVPVTGDEAAFVNEHGVDRFTELLLERDPDLLDWSRPSMLTAEESEPLEPLTGTSTDRCGSPECDAG
jgi:hypothetical protein